LSFLHISILPSVLIIFLIIAEKWISKEDYINFFKFFLSGIISGILLCIIFHFINSFYNGSAHYITILIKSLVIDGLLFSLSLLSLLFIVIKFFSSYNSFTWTEGSILSFFYITGVYFIVNITHTFIKETPNSILHYLLYIPYIIFISIITGLSLQKYFDSFEIYKKILWSIFAVSVLTITIAFYTFFNFFNSTIKYALILPIIVIFFIFELIDFKYYRK